MSMDLSKQIEELIKAPYSKSALEEIISWQNPALEIDSLQRLKELPESAGLKVLLKEFKKSIDIININLVIDDHYLNDEGKEWYKKREWLKEFVNLIDFRDDQKKVMQEEINDEKNR